MDTAQLRQAATAILGFLHPDGTLTPDRVHRADRDLSLRRHADGSGDVAAHLTPACYALWETILEPLARKRPDDGCGPDLRSPGQRRHDALEDAAKRLLRNRGTAEHRRGGDHPDDQHDPAAAGDPGRAGHHPPPRCDQHRRGAAAGRRRQGAARWCSTPPAGSWPTAGPAGSPRPGSGWR